MVGLYEALYDASNDGHWYDYVTIEGNGVDGYVGGCDISHGVNVIELTNDARSHAMSVNTLLDCMLPNVMSYLADDNVDDPSLLFDPVIAEFDYVEYGDDEVILHM